jgi:soluble lytic murein transglycosylase-like protein
VSSRAFIAALVAVLAVAGCGGGSSPSEERSPHQAVSPTATPTPTPTPDVAGNPDAPLPRDPGDLASDLTDTRDSLWKAIGTWRSSGAATIPDEVALFALHQQRIYRMLGRSPRLSRRVLAALPARLRGEARDNVIARREITRIVSVHRGPPPKIAIGPAKPADVLRGYYRRAHRRFGVGPALLAAVNFVESAFGRLRNRSVSGARGPMQFMPATWRAYGLGGDITDPRDAILGAANYLHANGAPQSELRALLHYNPSRAYANAIQRYTRRIRADWRAFYAYYAWSVYVGGRRLTGPGR